MLLAEYGYRAPSAVELAATAAQGALRLAREWKDPTLRRPATVVQSCVISADPLISYCGISRAPLGVASLLTQVPRNHRGFFLLSPTWSIEQEDLARDARARAVLHRLRHPHHSFIFLCNSPGEVDLMRERGEAAVCINKTFAISEETFRPLAGAVLEFDAIYNARLEAWKRHELALGIERCAFIFYRDQVGVLTRVEETAIMERHARLAPRHVFINALDAAGTPIRLTREEVNFHLNRAAVGLCLSSVEGAMLASTEYLLAGLPVVTTPNHGGRDVYLDPEFSITAAPDPRAVAEAVTALKARRIPRDYVRRRTLERIERERRRFIDLVNAIFAEAGSEHRIAMPWPFKRPVLMEWLPRDVARERAMRGTVDAFAAARAA